MSFALESVSPWGRSEAEYRAMFSLAESDTKLRILGCGDRPDAFNGDWSRSG